MRNLFNPSLLSKDKNRILVLFKDKNGNTDWIDAAELAQAAGITPEKYPTWLNSIYETGEVVISDSKSH